MKTITLQIKGISCADCAGKVEKVLKAAIGVKDLKILSVAEKAVVTYDEALTTPDELRRSVESIGYKVEGVVRQKKYLADTLRFAFIAAIGIIALGEIGLEYFGLLEKGIEIIPIPVILIAIILGGYPIFKKAFLGILHKQINVDLMMSVGIIGAAAIGEFTSSMLVAFFMNLAHYLEEFTVTRSRQAIKELIKLAPKTAKIKRDKKEIEVDISELKQGDIVVVRPGEKIPVDGVVTLGSSSVNQATITGESMPVEKKTGDEVFAATLNEAGYLEIRTTKVGEDTALGKIIKLVEEAEAHKAPVQKFADRFTAYFLPSAGSFAILTYIVSGKAIYAIAVLVAACPCAVGLAIPLSVIASVGSSARKGLLIKGGLYLEALAKVDCVVMDKTGTITFGKPYVTDIMGDSREVLYLAASVEKRSEHPLASAVIEKAEREGIELIEPEGFEYLIGRGVIAIAEGKAVMLGNQRLFDERDISIPDEIKKNADAWEQEGKTILFLGVDSLVKGVIAVSDVLRDEVPKAIDELKKQDMRLILLTGDNERVAKDIANKLGIKEYRANLLPEDKIGIIKKLQAEGHKVCMIGDGVNDAPALAQADVGIAMGVAGTDVAIEASHVALMRDDWSQVPQAIRVGRNTYKIIRQGITLGITWAVITMGLASIGILTPVMAAALEEIPSLIVAANASRLLINSRKIQ